MTSVSPYMPQTPVMQTPPARQVPPARQAPTYFTGTNIRPETLRYVLTRPEIGCTGIRQNGTSHLVMQAPNGERFTLPVGTKKDVSPGSLRDIGDILGISAHTLKSWCQNRNTLKDGLRAIREGDITIKGKTPPATEDQSSGKRLDRWA